MRTYGSVALSENERWLSIRLEPHVAMRFKRVFPKIDKGKVGEILLSCTPENCRDLAWFMERYPLDAEGGIRKIRTLAQAHEEKQSLVERFLSGQQPPLALELEVPARDYQKVAASLFITTGALLLADDVGLGKTVSAIAALADPRLRPAIYVTLTHLPKQVQQFIGRFAPLLNTHVVKTGQPYDLTKLKGRKGALPFPDVIILSYSKLSGWADTLSKIGAKCVIWDEVQELRHSGSYRYEAAKLIADSVGHRCAMSATPIFGMGSEIFNVMEVIAPGALGYWDEFYTEWCTGKEQKAPIKDPAAFGRYLREAGLMLRRTRAEVGRELPPCTVDFVTVEADLNALNQVSATCAELAKTLLSSGGKGIEKMRAAQDFDWRLRQATGVAKAVYVADFVRLLVEAGEKVVVYAWHRAVYDLLHDKLKDIPHVFYTGEESTPQKDAAKEAFLSGQAKVLIMSLRSGAGLDGLQGSCNIVVFAELDWAPAVHEQSIGRVWRDGQGNPVNVYFCVAEEGSDPYLLEVTGVKKQQLTGLRDPNVELVQKLQVDPDRVKQLARQYLTQKGIEIPDGSADQSTEPNVARESEPIEGVSQPEPASANTATISLDSCADVLRKLEPAISSTPSLFE